MKNSSLNISTGDKITLFSNLATMLTAGISILEVVDSLAEDAKGNSKKLLLTLRQDLVQGKRIYASLEKFPRAFDKVTISIIKASEEAGSLDVTLKDIKNHLQKEMEFYDKVKSAMIYPIFIFFVFIGVMLMILVFVMPRMASVFLRMKADLPLPTKIMIATSSFILSNYVALIIGFVIFVIGVILIYKKNRNLILGILFAFPLISELVKQIDIARFTRSMSLLLSSGLTITSALELSEAVVLRRDVARMIHHTHATVVAGKQISDGMSDFKGMVPTIVIKIIEAGEKTGTLDKSLQDISEHMDYTVEHTLDTLTTLLEPIMLVFIGGVVGGMMLAIIAPIYSLIGQLNKP